nr:fimbrial protein [Klebsiella aerogenes]
MNFTGQVVNAACSVSADSIDQTVTLSQVRTSKLTAAGMVANQKEDFSIKLEDCDTTVSQNAAVIFNGQQDSSLAGSLANTAGAGSATNVALQLYGPDGQVLNIGDTSGAITLINGENTVPPETVEVSAFAAQVIPPAAMAVITIAKRCFFINNLLNTQVENKLITNFSTERSSQSSLVGTGRKKR